MPIVFAERNNRSTPIVICDHCREEITSAADGNCEWNGDDETKGAALYFTHKRCCHPFESQSKVMWSTIDLDLLPIYLGNSLGVDWEGVNRRANLLDRMG